MSVRQLHRGKSIFIRTWGTFLFLFLFRELGAFHIVGGEIEMIHIGAPGEYRYRLNVIQYFDRAQQFNPGPEQQIFVFSYRKRDRALMRQDTLFLSTQVRVEYTNPECEIAQLQTDRVVFTREVTLDPSQFDDPEGYFFVWERCCRNGSVVNINNPLSTGMTYTVEFPPIIKDGVPFVNSSPSLFPPLSDFACVGELYYADFAGTDLDGDQIVYSLAAPLNSSSTTALPIPQFPDPNRQVVWIDGIDNSNIIPGAPSLNINSAGFMTVRPDNPGLYVFAALAEEFRDGVKIGETRRDFQLLVIDGCEEGNPPDVTAINPDLTVYQEGDIFVIDENDPQCFNFLVTDPDGEEDVTLRALGVNFDMDVSEIFSVDTATIAAGQVLTVQVCIPECPYLQDENFIIDLIAADDTCPLPRLDTLRMTFDVEPPPNNDPMFSDPDRMIDVFIEEGQTASLVIGGNDADAADTLDLLILNEGFDPAQFGMTFNPTTSPGGKIEVTYDLDGNCLTNDFGLQNEFELLLGLEDRDQCRFNDADSLILNVEVAIDNTAPVVTTDPPVNTLQIQLDQVIEFDVMVQDADGDTVVLEAFVEDRELSDLGIEFLPISGQATAGSPFSWKFSCEDADLSGLEEFTINFVGDDTDRCNQRNADTLSVVIDLQFPVNNPPEISGYEDGEVIDARVNTPIEQILSGIDTDGNNLTISLLDTAGLAGAESLEFPTVEGGSSVSSTFTWMPECSLLDADNTAEIEVSFLLQDDGCPNPKTDTLTVVFQLFETPVSFDGFTPPNVITPNGDTFNELFSLSGNDDNAFNLPPDSCDDTFLNVTVVNRYGQSVFESSDRNFAWDAQDYSEGTYYYNLIYTRSEYRGVLTVVH